MMDDGLMNVPSILAPPRTFVMDNSILSQIKMPIYKLISNITRVTTRSNLVLMKKLDDKTVLMFPGYFLVA